MSVARLVGYQNGEGAHTMPKVSVVMPVYGVEKFVAAAVESVLAQSYEDFELLVVDDCSPDRSVEICQQYADPRIRIIRHEFNRGLAGARNTGVRHATGDYLGFLDSDDLWTPDKLERHVAHLDARPEVGVSFSRSAFVDEEGRETGYFQMPKLSGIEPGYYLCRNPIGNGSAPVIRRQVFEQIRYSDDLHGNAEDFYFDERFRRSEDIECWIRIALTTDWVIEGLPEALTLYRLNAGGLSASLLKQLESWEQMVEKIRGYAPDFLRQWEALARAYQLRYLSRQAIRLKDGHMAVKLLHRALGSSGRILLQEPARTVLTAGAAYALWLLPVAFYNALESFANRLVGRLQLRVVRRQIAAGAEGDGT